MKLHPSSSKEWLLERAVHLDSSGIVDLVRRRSQLLLFASAMRKEQSRFGAKPYEGDPAQRAAESARDELLAAWAIAESTRRRNDGITALDVHIVGASQ